MRVIPKNKMRLLVLIVIFLALIPPTVQRYRKLGQSGDYACTISLGHGYGHTFYYESYYKLPRMLRDAVEVHEAVHLENGTWRFWDEAESEFKAYNVEIEYEENAKHDLFVRYQEVHDKRLIIAWTWFNNFQREAIAMRDTYREQRKFTLK